MTYLPPNPTPYTSGNNEPYTPDQASWSPGLATPPPPPPKKSRKGIYIVLALVIGLVFIVAAACVAALGGAVDDLAKPATSAAAPAATPAGKKAAPPVATPKAKPQPVTIGHGGPYLIGTDVQPGKYRTTGLADGELLCYWHTADDATDNTIDVQGVTDKTDAPARVTLVKGQYFKTSGCEPWVRQ